MRYFLIEKDKGFIYLPRFKDLHKQISQQDICTGRYDKLARRLLLRVEENKETQFTEVLVGSVFAVVESLKTLLNKFEPNLNFKQCILLDQKYERTENYFLPMLEEIECLSDQCTYNMYHTEFMKIVTRQDMIKDKSIFAIRAMNKRYVIARLDVVEAFLRRNATGFTITEIETE